MAESSDFHIAFNNESTKKFEAVLFGCDDWPSSSYVAWLVFKDREVKTSVPDASSIGFSYHLDGTIVSVGPIPASAGSSWTLKEDGGQLSLTEDVPQSGALPSNGIIITNRLPSTWTGTNPKFELYKCDRLFLFIKDTIPIGEPVFLPTTPNLCFGLTKQNIKQGDIFTDKKIFSPLATLERSFYTKGINIGISNNPAGRPHVTIDRYNSQ